MPEPVLIYDGRCGFCKIWIEYWKLLTGDRVKYAPSQEVASRYPQIPSKAFAQSVQLVRSDGTVASGARAAFEALGMKKTYEANRVFAFFAEVLYRFVARHRDFSYKVTRFTFGTKIEPTQFQATQWIFLRALALIYAAAFGSLALQITGLIGEHGILPLQEYLDAVTKALGTARFIAMPSIFWFGSGDIALTAVCWFGVALAALLFLGYLPRLMLILLFILYLSLSTAGQQFLSFQWDSLLLEAGFLAIFLGRAQIVDWLFRWLVFRLSFLSGSVKLLSGDVSWRNLTAISFHYHTQPLPTVLAWFADKFPMGFDQASTVVVLLVEIGAPFLIFTPRLTRMFGAWCIIGLQILILLTGNYGFFNYLTLALCLFLFDDQALRRFVPRRVLGGEPSVRLGRVKRALLAALAAFILILGVSRMMEIFTGSTPPVLEAFTRLMSPYQIVNSYGLFAVMTTTRPEIIVEGSNDGDTWLPYEFRYKPGDLHRAPRWIAPFQPRLDWQMWFAALGNYRESENLWFLAFTARLLQGSPEVLRLLEKNPFPGHPPKYIRAQLYEYSFSDWATLRKSGEWWTRTLSGSYLPAIGMRPAQ